MNIFITGGSKGIGAALASLYGSKGHVVGICSRSLTPRDNEYQVDVVDKAQLISAVDEFEAKNGEIDIFVANAGVGLGSKPALPNFEKDRKLVDINVIGFLNSVESIVPKFIQRKKGHFVAISSVASMVGLPGNGSYCASKAFVSRYSESLSKDLIKQGIYVTCIQPSYIDTELTQKNDHAMPFMITADKAALKIEKAIRKKKVFCSFVFPISFVCWGLGVLPKWMHSNKS